MKTLPSVVDEKGDINLHGRQGVVITIPFQDDNGDPRDMSGRTLTFECGPTVNIPLTEGVTADEMVLTITNDDVKAIVAQNIREFVLIDSTAGDQPTPLWIGQIFVTGWTE